MRKIAALSVAAVIVILAIGVPVASADTFISRVSGLTGGYGTSNTPGVILEVSLNRNQYASATILSHDNGVVPGGHTTGNVRWTCNGNIFAARTFDLTGSQNFVFTGWRSQTNTDASNVMYCDLNVTVTSTGGELKIDTAYADVFDASSTLPNGSPTPAPTATPCSTLEPLPSGQIGPPAPKPCPTPTPTPSYALQCTSDSGATFAGGRAYAYGTGLTASMTFPATYRIQYDIQVTLHGASFSGSNAIAGFAASADTTNQYRFAWQQSTASATHIIGTVDVTTLGGQSWGPTAQSDGTPWGGVTTSGGSYQFKPTCQGPAVSGTQWYGVTAKFNIWVLNTATPTPTAAPSGYANYCYQMADGSILCYPPSGTPYPVATPAATPPTTIIYNPNNGGDCGILCGLAGGIANALGSAFGALIGSLQTLLVFLFVPSDLGAKVTSIADEFAGHAVFADIALIGGALAVSFGGTAISSDNPDQCFDITAPAEAHVCVNYTDVTTPASFVRPIATGVIMVGVFFAMLRKIEAFFGMGNAVAETVNGGPT